MKTCFLPSVIFLLSRYRKEIVTPFDTLLSANKKKKQSCFVKAIPSTGRAMASSTTATSSTVPTYPAKKATEKTWTFTVGQIVDTR